MFIKHVNEVTSVNWGITTLWDMRFVSTPSQLTQFTTNTTLNQSLSAVVDGAKQSLTSLFGGASDGSGQAQTVTTESDTYWMPPNAPFDKWFPATDVEEDLCSVESATFEVYNTTIRIPAKVSPRNLHVTVNDDVNGTIRKWVQAWCRKISNPTTGYVMPLYDCLGVVQIIKYGFRYDPAKQAIAGLGDTIGGGFGSYVGGAVGGLATGAAGSVLGALEGLPGADSISLIQKTVIDITTYKIYPEDNVKFVGQSEAGLVQYSLNFVIVDEI